MTFGLVLSIIVIGFNAVGLLCGMHVVMNGRTSQGTIAWLLSLLILPYITVPLYLVLGRKKFIGYNNKKSRETIDKSVFYKYVKKHRHQELTEQASRINKLLERTVGSGFLANNYVELLIDGDATFAAILAGIDQAQDYILVQYFIVKDDEIGKVFKDKLIKKAQAGVKVYFIYDEVGCHKLPPKYLEELEVAGIIVTGFKSTRGWLNRFQINFRNHRKIVVVDGKKAFMGGLNVGDEYLGRDPKFGHWRDTHLELTGPSVQLIQASFARDWFWAMQKLPEWNWEAELTGDHSVNIIPTGPTNTLETCSLFFIEAITSAKKRVWITSPYFVPDIDIVSALKLAALRGVDVRVMLPNKADHKLVYLSAFSYLDEAENAGVKIFRYQKGFLHQKVLLVDEEYAVVGTVNLDNRSLKINFEISLICIAQDFIKKVEKMLDQDFRDSVQVKSSEYHNRNIFFKIAVRVARLLSPVL